MTDVIRESQVDIGKLIVASPDIRHNRPRIAGTGVTVQRVVGWYRLGLTPEEISDRAGHLNLRRCMPRSPTIMRTANKSRPTSRRRRPKTIKQSGPSFRGDRQPDVSALHR